MAVTPVQTTRSTQTFPKRVVPPIELPAGTAHLASEAAAQLGWAGTVLELELIGRSVAIVANLRMDVHAERLVQDAPPMTDRATVSTWTWPEMACTVPAQAAEIVGVLSVARHWRTGLASVVPFARYYSEAALVLPNEAVFTQDYVDNCLPRARVYGVGVVSASEDAIVDLNLEGRTERTMLPPDALTRWVNEVAYEKLLAS